jgi:hypothetical protein
LTWQTWRDHLILEYEIPKYEGDLGHPNFYVPLSTLEAKVARDGSPKRHSGVSCVSEGWSAAPRAVQPRPSTSERRSCRRA